MRIHGVSTRYVSPLASPVSVACADLQSYAVFLAYYLSNNVFPDASPITYAFIGGLSISIALLVSPLCTMLVGRYGTRPTLFFGTVLET